MGTLRVEFEVLRSQAASLDEAFEQTDELLTRLEGELKSALRDWSGDANDAFRQRYDDWVAAARELHADLPKIRDFVLNAHDNHARALSANVDIWRV